MRTFTHVTALMGALTAGVCGDQTVSYTTDSPQRWYSTGAPFIVTDVAAFVLQSDGNLVIADHSSNILWNSGTTGHNCANSNCFLQWQGDGNLVLLEMRNGSPVYYWQTHTYSYENEPGYNIHRIAARTIVFGSSQPLLQLLAPSGEYEWETDGYDGNKQNNPDPGAPPTPPNPPPPQPQPSPPGGGCDPDDQTCG